MVITIIIAFGSALLAAVLGAYLQRLWTPDPRPQIATLATQLTTFQQRVETIEQERTELENFTLEISLQQAAPQNYILVAKNDSDRNVNVESVSIEYKGIPLSRPTKPKPSDDWTIKKQGTNSFCFAPQRDPVTQLMYSSVAPPPGVAVPITLVFLCRIDGKLKPVRGTQIVTVDIGNRTMTPFGP
jgi:hypothetical protein